MHITVILKWKEKRKWCVTSVNKVVRSAIVVGKQLKMNYLHGQKYDFDDVDVGKIATKSTNGTFTKYLEMILEVVITESCYQSVLLTGSMRFLVLQVRKNMNYSMQSHTLYHNSINFKLFDMIFVMETIVIG